MPRRSSSTPHAGSLLGQDDPLLHCKASTKPDRVLLYANERFLIHTFLSTMGKKAFIFWSSALLWFAVLWQGFLSDFVFITLGVGRTIQKIEEFPYTCKRIRSTLLESCEDIWLDEAGRRLYAACSTIANRAGWAPGSVYPQYTTKYIFGFISVF